MKGGRGQPHTNTQKKNYGRLYAWSLNGLGLRKFWGLDLYCPQCSVCPAVLAPTYRTVPPHSTEGHIMYCQCCQNFKSDINMISLFFVFHKFVVSLLLSSRTVKYWTHDQHGYRYKSSSRTVHTCVRDAECEMQFSEYICVFPGTILRIFSCVIMWGTTSLSDCTNSPGRGSVSPIVWPAHENISLDWILWSGKCLGIFMWQRAHCHCKIYMTCMSQYSLWESRKGVIRTP
jgi:hypothetical protein